jgi:threonyl-tRNA synthetase
MIIVGEKEVENKTVTVRRRFIKEQKELSLDDFSNEVLTEINERSVSN